MKILHILNHTFRCGNGIVNVAIDLACIQAKGGHDVAIASVMGEYQPLLQQYNVNFFHLNQARTLTNLLHAPTHYREIIRTFQPDIVHAHMMTGVVLGRVLRLGSKYRLVSTVHNEFQRSSILMGLADEVIAVSEAVAMSMKRRGIPQHKLHVIRNGTLGSPRTKPLEQYIAAGLKHPSILTVAGMYDRKGISELIEAFCTIAPKFPDANLYLVGDGDDRQKFEAQAQESHFAERIHFEKFQPEPQRYLKSTDIFVLASHKDPSPLVIPEAREAGCAIIATQVDGIPEALNYGKAGYLVAPKSVSHLAQALTELLSDKNTLATYQQRSQNNLDYLNVSRVHRETIEVYKKSLI